MRSREPRIRFRRIGDRFRTSSSTKDAENREMNILKKKLFLDEIKISNLHIKLNQFHNMELKHWREDPFHKSKIYSENQKTVK